MIIYRKWYKLMNRLVLIMVLVIITARIYKRYKFEHIRALWMYGTQKDRQIIIETLLQDLVSKEKKMGCKMPVLNPFSDEASKFDKDVEAVTCDDEDWVECNFSECYVKTKTLSQLKNVTCIYKDIIYVDDDTNYFGKSHEVQWNEKHLLNISDYVKVVCTGIKDVSRGQKWVWWKGYKAGFRRLNFVQKAAEASAVNVLMLIIDSTSRNTFIRRLPVSYKVLREELQAVVMERFNIVGESTIGAMMPILSGHNEFELPDTFRRPTNGRLVDPEPFLFTLLKQYGYRTAFFEDMPWFHTFNFRHNGFEYMPATHYMRVLFQGIGWSNEKNWSDKQRYCFGSKSLFKFMTEYSAKLFEMNGKKFCVTLSGTFSHNDLNMITTIDEELADFLRKFKQSGHLQDTLLFVMSDHGSRLSDIRDTYYGRIEEYLPFVSVVLPEVIKQTRPKALQNLKDNSNVLTTPFDIHTTILDALGLKQHRNKYKVPGASIERGVSFLEPMLESRSCGEAGIMPHFCACARWLSVSANDLAYTRVAVELAAFVNGVTASNRHKCAERYLLSIVEVYRLDPMVNFNELIVVTNRSLSSTDENFNKRLRANQEYYQAKIVMSPGEAIFEGAMQYDVKSGVISIFDKDVSRIDRYGDEPWCVSQTHPLLSKYCHCINKLA